MFHNTQAKFSDSPALKISKYLNPKLMTFIHSTERNDALKELVELLDMQKKLEDKDAFYQAILEREKIVSTGIGMGVAVPHAKLADYDTFFIAVGISSQPIAWDSIDSLPVRLIFMIGGPDDKQTEYLQLLSRLTLAIKDSDRRKKMLQLNNPKDMMALFKGI